MKFLKFIITVLATSFLLTEAVGQETTLKVPNYSKEMEKEKPGRGLIAIKQPDGKVSISWRYLETDPLDIAFDLFKQNKKGKAVKINTKPIIKSTYFTDSTLTINEVTYYLRICANNINLAEYKLTKQLAQQPYISIPMQAFAGDTSWAYQPNDASVGDVDNDGEFEIIVKRDNHGYDNSHRGLCNGGTLLEAYKLNGTFLWRVDLGINIRQGAHYSPFMVYDFDGDGKSEIAVRTAEGTRFGDGQIIGDVNKDRITDYVDHNPASSTFGMITQGPEFLSVIEGATGKELARADFISRGAPGEFGDTNANRSDRFLGGAGYFDGVHPSILICRGYYAKTVLEAWDYRNGKLTRRWNFNTSANGGQYKSYEGQGNHNLSIGDVDGDGKDEITYGACLIDDDGSGAYNTLLGHGDAIHLTDIDIDRPGLEVWDCHEHVPSRAGSELRDARTGQLIWGIPSVEDVGRALAADIDPRFRGCEVWTTASDGVYTADGRMISEHKPSINMAIWWDGDLNRELLDGSGVTDKEFVVVSKWNGDGVDKLPLPDDSVLAANNWTKGNPCLAADILGDWREEIIVRTKNNREIRVYMTPYSTDYRFHTLMSDHIYRMSVVAQNVAYNQPTQMGNYLGSDLGKFWPRHYESKGVHSKSGVTEDNRPNGMNARLKGATLKVENEITSNKPKYTFDASYNYDTYTWTVDGKPINGNRILDINSKDYGINHLIPVSLKANFLGCVFLEDATLMFTE